MSSDDHARPTRRQRRAATSRLRAGGKLDQSAFLRVAGKFIDLANRENTHVEATELHMALLYAAARYSAHVGKAVLDVPDHEAFVADMTRAYQEMLRQHLADPALDPPKG
jgi:hypothetical protein